MSVKNTFLVIDELPEAPGPLDLSRGKTAPGGPEPALARMESADTDGTPADEADEAPGDLPDIAPPPALCRWVTQDYFEPAKDWEWTTEAAPAPNAGLDPAAPPPGPPDLCRFQTDDPFEQSGISAGGVQPKHLGLELPVVPPTGGQPVVPGMQPGMVPVQIPMAFPGFVQGPGVGVFLPMAPPGSFPQNQMQAAGAVRGMRWPQQGGQPMAPFGQIGGTQENSPAPQDTSPPPPPMQPGLQRNVSVRSQCERFHWTVTEKQIKSSDKVAVSPAFNVQGANFKMILKPVVQHDHKGGMSFRAAKGRASVQLKCETPQGPSHIKFRVFVGRDLGGQVVHPFATSSICQTPDVWDLTESVSTGTVTLGVEIFSVC